MSRRPARTTWLAPQLAVGTVRDGERGWFLLGERPADGRARPMVAWGKVDARGVHVEHGAIGDEHQRLLRAASID